MKFTNAHPPNTKHTRTMKHRQTHTRQTYIQQAQAKHAQTFTKPKFTGASYQLVSHPYFAIVKRLATMLQVRGGLLFVCVSMRVRILCV